MQLASKRKTDMRFNRSLGTALVAAAAAWAAAPAQAAFTFDSAGDSMTTLYEYAYAPGTFLTASVTYTLQSLSGNSAVFSVNVANTTTAAQTGTNRLTTFGVGVLTPDLAGTQSDNSSVFNVQDGGNAPSGVGWVDFCATSGGTCSGGAGGGLGEAQTHTFNMTLQFVSSVAGGVSFDSPFYVRYQSVGSNDGSIAFQGCIAGTPGCGGGGGGGQVPEPGSLALASVALLGLAARLRRRKG